MYDVRAFNQREDLAGTPLLRAQLDPRPLKDHTRVPYLPVFLWPQALQRMTPRNSVHGATRP